MPRATLILDNKFWLASGAIVQIRVWRLPTADDEWPHGLKYSLFYGHPGERIVAYDNETGKSDHRHYRTSEEPYVFTTLEQLVRDFERDVRREVEREGS
ncbi:toxin-antitoxin system TumE family protein [Rhizobium tumorigenes]|uniref:DUF6516 family protein n=1 Tax=Rhizobium tumorigenes TaxID=2041385 RepID=A0AAF1KR18_9HYPH|nr:DUF6516 family protein [Rhizobium tumorigenes]WFR96222.1 DUF6516 family protein [Rhizobium tumorigenes]